MLRANLETLLHHELPKSKYLEDYELVLSTKSTASDYSSVKRGERANYFKKEQPLKLDDEFKIAR